MAMRKALTVPHVPPLSPSCTRLKSAQETQARISQITPATRLR